MANWRSSKALSIKRWRSNLWNIHKTYIVRPLALKSLMSIHPLWCTTLIADVGFACVGVPHMKCFFTHAPVPTCVEVSDVCSPFVMHQPYCIRGFHVRLSPPHEVLFHPRTGSYLRYWSPWCLFHLCDAPSKIHTRLCVRWSPQQEVPFHPRTSSYLRWSLSSWNLDARSWFLDLCVWVWIQCSFC